MSHLFLSIAATFFAIFTGKFTANMMAALFGITSVAVTGHPAAPSIGNIFTMAVTTIALILMFVVLIWTAVNQFDRWTDGRNAWGSKK